MESFEEKITFENLFEKPILKSNHTVKTYFEYQVERMKELGKIGTASKYRYCLKLLMKSNAVNIRFEAVDLSYLRKFEMFLVKKGNKGNSIATKFSVFRSVYNKAAADGLFTIEDDPFTRFKPGRYWTNTRKRAISKEDIHSIRNLDLPFDRSPFSLSFARDIFLFSYLVAGINFRDIATLRHSDVVDGRLYYQRHKTGKELNCLLRPAVKTILDAYDSQTSNPDDYIFPILFRTRHKTPQQIYNRLQKVLRTVNSNLKEIARLANVQAELTTYVARHTFATVLKRSGVSIEIISESLGHADITTTQIYLDSFENSQVDEAMNHLI